MSRRHNIGVVDFGRLAASQLLAGLVLVRVNEVTRIVAEVIVPRQLGELLGRGGAVTARLGNLFDAGGGRCPLLLREHGMAQSRALRVLRVVVGSIPLTVVGRGRVPDPSKLFSKALGWRFKYS